MALGYGKKDLVQKLGVNAYPLFDRYNTIVSGVTIEKADADDHEFGGMQSQNTLMGRCTKSQRGFSR